MLHPLNMPSTGMPINVRSDEFRFYSYMRFRVDVKAESIYSGMLVRLITNTNGATQPGAGSYEGATVAPEEHLLGKSYYDVNKTRAVRFEDIYPV